VLGGRSGSVRMMWQTGKGENAISSTHVANTIHLTKFKLLTHFPQQSHSKLQNSKFKIAKVVCKITCFIAKMCVPTLNKLLENIFNYHQ